MADGASVMRRQIARLRELAKLTEISADNVADAVKREIIKQVRRGVGPDGRPWEPTKAGTAPLKKAAGALSVRALGSVILIVITGHHARHHLGAVKGKQKREIIPTGKIPRPVSMAIDRILTGEFRAIMGPG